jgi:hypothetical protein
MKKDFYAKSITALIILTGSMVGLLLEPWTVSANSAPPTSEIWFIFAEPPEAMNEEGTQLVGCNTIECEQPVLLGEYGICFDEGCLLTSPLSTDWVIEFECKRNMCWSRAHKYPTPYFKLIIQYSDRVRSTNVLDGLPTDYWGQKIVWSVAVNDNSLSATPDDIVEQSGNRIRLFLTGLLSTIFIELVVATTYLKLWLQPDIRRLVKTLVIVLLVHVISFPAVWFLFPSLGQFQLRSARTFGVMILIVSNFYALLLVLFFVKKPWRTGLTILGAISIPVVSFFALIALFVSGYGSDPILVTGVPFWTILILSEIFAVVVEGVLVKVMSKGFLTWRQAGVMSLLTNTTSFVWGLIVLGI